jgi:hypothetical protein
VQDGDSEKVNVDLPNHKSLKDKISGSE